MSVRSVCIALPAPETPVGAWAPPDGYEERWNGPPPVAWRLIGVVAATLGPLVAALAWAVS